MRRTHALLLLLLMGGLAAVQPAAAAGERLLTEDAASACSCPSGFTCISAAHPGSQIPPRLNQSPSSSPSSSSPACSGHAAGGPSYLLWQAGLKHGRFVLQRRPLAGPNRSRCRRRRGGHLQSQGGRRPAVLLLRRRGRRLQVCGSGVQDCSRHELCSEWRRHCGRASRARHTKGMEELAEGSSL